MIQIQTPLRECISISCTSVSYGDFSSHPVYLVVNDQRRKCGSIKLKPSLLFQIAVWNSYRGMNLTESNREKNNNVTDSLANRTLIVTTILVRRKVNQRTEQAEGWDGGVHTICDVYSIGQVEGQKDNTMREERGMLGKLKLNMLPFFCHAGKSICDV